MHVSVVTMTSSSMNDLGAYNQQLFQLGLVVVQKYRSIHSVTCHEGREERLVYVR